MTLTVPVLPDVEMMAAAYLRSVSEVSAIVGTRVFTTLPPSPQYPTLVLHRAGGIPVLRQWLDAARIQVDAWGRTKLEATALAATARAALHSMPGAYSGGVVSGVDDAIGLTWLPDPDSNQPRVLLAVTLYSHPSN